MCAAFFLSPILRAEDPIRVIRPPTPDLSRLRTGDTTAKKLNECKSRLFRLLGNWDAQVNAPRDDYGMTHPDILKKKTECEAALRRAREALQGCQLQRSGSLSRWTPTPVLYDIYGDRCDEPRAESIARGCLSTCQERLTDRENEARMSPEDYFQREVQRCEEAQESLQKDLNECLS